MATNPPDGQRKIEQVVNSMTLTLVTRLSQLAIAALIGVIVWQFQGLKDDVKWIAETLWGVKERVAVVEQVQKNQGEDMDRQRVALDRLNRMFYGPATRRDK